MDWSVDNNCLNVTFVRFCAGTIGAASQHNTTEVRDGSWHANVYLCGCAFVFVGRAIVFAQGERRCDTIGEGTRCRLTSVDQEKVLSLRTLCCCVRERSVALIWICVGPIVSCTTWSWTWRRHINKNKMPLDQGKVLSLRSLCLRENVIHLEPVNAN